MTICVRGYLKRRPDITQEEFREAWKRHAALLQTMKSFTENIVRYSQFNVSPEPTTVLKAAGMEIAPYDGIADLEVEKLEDLYSLLGSQEYAEKIVPDEMTFLDRKSVVVMAGEYRQEFQRT